MHFSLRTQHLELANSRLSLIFIQCVLNAYNVFEKTGTYWITLSEHASWIPTQIVNKAMGIFTPYILDYWVVLNPKFAPNLKLQYIGMMNLGA